MARASAGIVEVRLALLTLGGMLTLRGWILPVVLGVVLTGSGSNNSKFTAARTFFGVLVRATVCETSVGTQWRSLSSDRLSTREENPTTLSRLVGQFEIPISFAGFRYGVKGPRSHWLGNGFTSR